MKPGPDCSRCWVDKANPERVRYVCSAGCERSFSIHSMQQQAQNLYIPMAERPTKAVYVAGSMRNEKVPLVAEAIRACGIDAFDDWFAPGPEADDNWKQYESFRGRTYKEALHGYAAKTCYELDKKHLDRCTHFVLVSPAGKSAHMELGYMVGKGKRAYVLFDGEPDRWDIMYQFATDVFFGTPELLEELKR
jgi:nucleoside 2-deoxyribosyltransferase